MNPDQEPLVGIFFVSVLQVLSVEIDLDSITQVRDVLSEMTVATWQLDSK